MTGILHPMEEVPDPAFSEKLLGDGFAVELTGGEVKAPVSGTIAAAFPTGHAFGVKTKAGMEILIHIGIDTVSLQGKGFDVKVSEVHGMSQRGGSVVTYVRFGEKVYSPIIDRGQADVILSFELLEAARWLSYLKPDGQIVTSTQQIDPMPVITGAASYPEGLVEKMRASGAKVDALDCLKLAEEAGSSKAVNIVLMGRLSHYFDLPDQAWQDSLEAMVPPKFLELNKKAFALGKNA